MWRLFEMLLQNGLHKPWGGGGGGGKLQSWCWGHGTRKRDFSSNSVEFPKKCQLHNSEGAC